MHECSPGSPLRAYLLARRAQGYAIVGLEQTSRSRQLGAVRMPPRAVILLGAEREGIPADLLPLLDLCIEIPQFGVVRSFNVHVAGALLAWEFTRQRLEEMKTPDSTSVRVGSS